MENYTSYASYIKPSRSPPSYLFGIVRPILYVLIFISYGHVFIQIFQKKLPLWIIIPFAINIVSNLLFTYIWFKKDNLLLGFIDILIVLTTIIVTIIVMRDKIRRVAYLQIPYLIRVLFASFLAGWIFLNN